MSAFSNFVDEAGVTRLRATGGGGSQAGAPTVLGPFSFTFDTPGLVDGVEFWTPAAGDILLDAWVEVDEVWGDGGFPPAAADIGAFVGINYGVFADTSPIDLSRPDETAAFSSISQSVQGGDQPSSPSLAGVHTAPSSRTARRMAPASIFTSDPFLLVVSQDGTKGGDDPASLQGAARLYVITATPTAF